MHMAFSSFYSLAPFLHALYEKKCLMLDDFFYFILVLYQNHAPDFSLCLVSLV